MNIPAQMVIGSFIYNKLLENEQEKFRFYKSYNNLNISEWQGYLCGPPPMVDFGAELLKKHGIKSDEIFYDKFTDSSNKD